VTHLSFLTKLHSNNLQFDDSPIWHFWILSSGTLELPPNLEIILEFNLYYVAERYKLIYKTLSGANANIKIYEFGDKLQNLYYIVTCGVGYSWWCDIFQPSDVQPQYNYTCDRKITKEIGDKYFPCDLLPTTKYCRK